MQQRPLEAQRNTEDAPDADGTFWFIAKCPVECSFGDCSTASFKRARVFSHASERHVREYLKHHLLYSAYHQDMEEEDCERVAATTPVERVQLDNSGAGPDAKRRRERPPEETPERA